MEPSYSYSFSLSEDELLDVHVDMILHTTVGKKRTAAAKKSSKGLMLAATVMTGMSVFVIWRRWTGFMSIADGHILLLAVSIALWVLGWSLFRNNSPKRARRSGARMIRSVGAYSLRQPHTISLSPTGFRFE